MVGGIVLKIEPLPGYPQSKGAKIECIAKVTIVSGLYLPGGFQVTEHAFGLSGDVNHIDFAEGSYELGAHNRFAVWDADNWFILHNRATGAETGIGTNVAGDVYLVKVQGT
jgi:hypothetical protein